MVFHVKHLEKVININIVFGRKTSNWKSVKSWLLSVAKKEKKTIHGLSYTVLNDEDVYKINLSVLKHNFYTDIITFDLSDTRNIIEGDVYISYGRIKENAKTFHVKLDTEYRRVLLHGLLHLVGYNDKSTSQQKEMRERENFYLARFDRYYNKKQNAR